MDKPIFKSVLEKKIQKALEPRPEILALWLGGSEATGKMDQYSDSDIVMISQNPLLPFSIIESIIGPKDIYLSTDGPYNQRFYVLHDSPETYYIDVVVFSEMSEEHYTEYYNHARHGTPVILFDKLGIMSRASAKPKLENSKIDFRNERAKFEIMYRTFLKEALRGKFIDALLFYQKLIHIYAKLLRNIHAPQKQDFSLRYLYLDLPQEKSQLIEGLFKVSSIRDMQNYSLLLQNEVEKLTKGE